MKIQWKIQSINRQNNYTHLSPLHNYLGGEGEREEMANENLKSEPWGREGRRRERERERVTYPASTYY